MNNKIHHIILLVALCISAIGLPAYAKINQNRGALLGGGGTNFSDRKPDGNGLYTGTHSVMRSMFGVYMDGAYATTMFVDPALCELPYGFAHGGGVCYDLQAYYFKLQFGVGIKIQDLTTSVLNTSVLNDQVSDDKGYSYTLRYDFYDRVDHVRNTSLQIPLLLGTGDKNLYAMAGIKVNINLESYSTIEAVGTTTATYDQFLGVFEEMDNHGMRKDVPMGYKYTTTHYPIDLLASLEVGGEWGTEYKPIVSRYRSANKPMHETEWRVRVAAFCDFGFWKTRYPSIDLIEIPEETKWDFCTFKMNNVLSSNKVHSTYLCDFYAGIKVTMLIGSMHYIKCVLCEQGHSEWDMVKPNKRPHRKKKLPNIEH